MKAIFVDTGAWYALVDHKDPDHAAVGRAVAEHRNRLTTSNFVIDETLTLLRYRLGWLTAQRFGEKARAGRLARVILVTPSDEETAWDIFVRYKDHIFSFTDCTSFALMQRMRLPTAIALDHDFRSFGLHCLP